MNAVLTGTAVCKPFDRTEFDHVKLDQNNRDVIPGITHSSVSLRVDMSVIQTWEGMVGQPCMSTTIGTHPNQLDSSYPHLHPHFQNPAFNVA